MTGKAGEDPLLALARAAAVDAYAPYSGVRVGAAVETPDGSMIGGCNVENASLGLTLCAERVALVGAVRAGHRRVTRVAVYVDGGEDRASVAPVPCGACLQFMAEFCAPETPIVTATGAARSLGDYLPHPFKLQK